MLSDLISEILRITPGNLLHFNLTDTKSVPLIYEIVFFPGDSRGGWPPCGVGLLRSTFLSKGTTALFKLYCYLSLL